MHNIVFTLIRGHSLACYAKRQAQAGATGVGATAADHNFGGFVVATGAVVLVRQQHMCAEDMRRSH